MAIKADDIDALAALACEKKLDLTIVGPEAPLAAGIVDRFQALGLPVFGPTQAAARLESSKVFAKTLMERYSIPCAHGSSFSSFDSALKYLSTQPLPVVVKADGLAAGKGVTVAATIAEAEKALYEIMQSRLYGAAGDSVLIEECLVGREVSFLAVSDGHTVLPLAAACDYKRAYNGNTGPNTGGMGGYSPPRFLYPALSTQIIDTIIKPTIAALAAEGTPYRGVLYAGLMITADGPKVLEFNARLGDPETQVILPLLETDLVEIAAGVIEGRLEAGTVRLSGKASVGVVMASCGYPGPYKTGFPIYGLDTLDGGTLVFHAGTRCDSQGQIVTTGGRVLSVVATGNSLADARRRAYGRLENINFEGGYYRRDIARFQGG